MIVAGRRKDLLDQIATEHPGIEAFVLDVADPASITHAASTLAASHPQLNVLVNNAGIMQTENLLDPACLPIAEDHVTTNLLGPIRMTYAFLPHLVTKDDAVVLNVTSALAFVPWPVTPTYNATKAALHSFSESLRVQLAGTPVQVIEVVPSGVRTGLMGQQDNEQAMPLDEFLTETLTLLYAQPDAKEIVVESAKFARHAEASGTYDQVLTMLGSVES
ncbi:short-chain dehydrogenase/reductase SDR [Parafrankia sp. EUN1f]|nr:short-chain dehydrogenase/reductase SDR [Parafrankia sp. EUN1f]